MANVKNANTFYIDASAADTGSSTTGNLAQQNVKLIYVILSATSASANLVLKDVTTGNNKLRLQLATNGESKVFDFSANPVLFPNGISPSTVSNCVATCVTQESRG